MALSRGRQAGAGSQFTQRDGSDSLAPPRGHLRDTGAPLSTATGLRTPTSHESQQKVCHPGRGHPVMAALPLPQACPESGGAVGEHGPVRGGRCAGPTGRLRRMGCGGGPLMPSAAEAQVPSVGHGVVTVTLPSLFVVSLVTRFPPNLDGVPGLRASIWDGTRAAMSGALPWVSLPPRGPRAPPPDPLEALRRVGAASVSLFAGEGLPPSHWPLFV